MIFVQHFMISAIKVTVEEKYCTLRNMYVSLTQRLSAADKKML